MYDQIRQDTIYIMLYAAVAMLSLIACCYLLFRQGNAFAPDITSPVCLRRWTAVFFAFMTLSHLWYMPSIYLTSSDDKMLCYNVGGMLDCMTTFPLAIVILFTMLQDRRRPLWPAWVMVAPSVVIMALSIANHSEALVPIFNLYLLLLGIGLIIYIVRATRQYGRWLRDNYADLEHKEVWQSFVVLAIVLLVFSIYALIYEGLAYLYAMQVIDAMFICYLLWRVETLSDLSLPLPQDLPADETVTEDIEDNALSLTVQANIASLLQKYCIDTQLYLQHDLTLHQLAKAIGTNRSYLSQYFSNQGTTRNSGTVLLI